MHFFDIVENNGFLTRAFPDGFSRSIILESLDLGGQSRFAFSLLTTERPNIEVKKWGKWETDYNAVLMFFYGKIVNINIKRFGFPRLCAINSTIMDEDNRYVHFKGDNVEVDLQIEYYNLWYEKGQPVFSDHYTVSNRSIIVKEIFF